MEQIILASDLYTHKLRVGLVQFLFLVGFRQPLCLNFKDDVSGEPGFGV
jgi:hypothetical protein